MRSFSAYLKINAALFSCGLLSFFLFNVIVDPEGRFSLVDIPGFNHEKTEAMESGGRAVKSRALEQGHYDTLILGSSRVENGISPRHVALETRRVYNAGLSSTNLYEIYQVFTFARNTHELKTVILGLDFLLFSGEQSVAGDFTNSQFAGRSAWLSDLYYIVSSSTFLSALTTVRKNREGQKSAYTNLGMRDRTLSYDANRINHHALFTKVTRNFMVDQELYAGFSYGFDRLELLRAIVQQCRMDGIELYLFIPPVHARNLDVLQALGLYPLFEQWKRDLVNVLAVDAVCYPRAQPIPLWDFTGYSSVTTEEVPSAAERGRPMRWYWEASHFKQELGDRVLDRLFGYHQPGRTMPEDFGVLLTAENIELHLAQMREQQKRYHETHPRELAEVASLAQLTQRFHSPRNDTPTLLATANMNGAAEAMNSLASASVQRQKLFRKVRCGN